MNTSHVIKRNPLSVSIAFALGCLGSVSATTMAAEPTPESSKMETITVVGERIDKSLRDTTTAVTVFNGDDLQSGEKDSISDIAVSAPNVVTSGFGAISIRGIDGTGAATGGYAFYSGARARISTIVDGTTQSWSGYSFTPSRAWDIQQLEVLRGPQSTAQGTNSIGGALVVVTNDPTYHWESKVRAGLESYENGNIKSNLAVMASGPLIENELAFRIAIDGSKGDGYMNYAQADTEFDSSPDLESAENINGRLKLLWEPASMPQLSAKLTYNRQSHEGEYLNWATEYDEPTLTLDDSNRSNVRLQDSTVETIAADVSYELSDGISNMLHISYLTTDVRFDQYPNAAREFYVTSDIDNLTIENRLLFQTPGSDWSGVAGVYYSNNDTLLDVSNSFTGPSKTEVSALFGETTYAVNEALKLVGGARFENEKIDRSLDYARDIEDFEQNTSENIFLPKVGLIYHLDNTTTLNASIRKGYNGGSASVNWDTFDYYTYDEETVIAYETGLLAEFEHGQLGANLFYNDYSGYQAFVQSEYIANIDDSRTYGFELSGDYWATDSLNLRGSFGYVNTEVLSDDQSFKGAELPNAPDTNVSVGFTQYFGQNWSVGADVYYVGEYYSDLENTQEYKAGDYTTADARVQYTIGNFTLDGYVKNLTDETVIYFNNSGSRAAVGQTRTFGISGTYHM